MKKLKLFFALFAMLALGVGNAWGAEKITDYSKIVTGKTYYIGATTGGTDYYLSVSGAATSTSIAGTAKTDKANATAFVFTGSGTSWTIKFTDYANYLGLKSSKDNGKVQVVSSAATFTASNQSEKLRLSIGSYSIQKNNSGTQFGSYGNTQTDIWLEEVPGSSEPTTQYTIKWHTAKGVTTDVTLSEGATITKPATEPTMTGYEFMGWTDQCNVATDGVGFTPLTNFGTADSDIDFYAVFAVAETTGGGGSSNYEKVTSNLADWAGDYLIAYNNTTFADGRTGGTSGMGAQNKKVDLSSKISNNAIPASVGDQYNVTLEAVSGGYVLKTKDGNYNYQSNNANGLTTTKTIATAASYAINVTFTSENDIKLALTGSAAGAVFRYNTQGYFRFYKNGGQSAVYLYKKTSGGGSTTTYSNYITTCSGSTPVENLTGAQFAWSAATAEATMGASNTFPILTNTLPVSVTYESSTPATATIAADGTITLVAPGTTTISAKFAGGEVSGTTYAAKTVKYDLTVLKAPATPTENVYVKVIETAGITDGEYLIVYEDAEGNPKAPVAFNGSLTTLDAVGNNIDVTINSNTIAGNSDIDKATFTLDVTNGTILSASGKYIGVTSYDNGLKQNAESSTYGAHSFEISEGNAIVKIVIADKGDMILNYNPSTNNGQRFRYYKEGSQKPIALYKKVDPSEILAPAFSVAAGSFYDAQSVVITCATPGAEIYYTLDGSTPSSTSTKYTSAVAISETKTLKAIAIKGGYSSSVTEATYTILAPLATMQEIFDKAKAVGTTATPVKVTMNNWVVTGVKGSNAYLTDGTKGLIIYTASHGFVVGDVLSGTVACKVQLYNGSSELTELTNTTEGLTVTTGGTVTPVVVNDVTTLNGVNTGSVIKITGTCTVESSKYYVADVQLYNSLFAYTNPTVGKKYNVTGVYLQYGEVEEILPRKQEDIEEVQDLATATISVSNISLEVDETKTIEATITPDAAKTTVKYTITAGSENVTLNGATITGVKEGTATITATIAEAAGEYYGTTKDFTVTVTPKSTKDNVVVLAKYGDQWYAMMAQYVSGKTSHLAALPVSYVGGKLYNVADADKALIEWTRAVVDGKATFSNNSKYLTGKSDKTDLTLTATSCDWTISGESYMMGERTFFYNAENNWFRNFKIENVDAKNYSGMPVVTAPEYATGTLYEIKATAENGTIIGAGTYVENTTVTLTANPAMDYTFVNWTKGGEVVSIANPFVFKATENLDLVANFKAIPERTTDLTGTFSVGQYEVAQFATGNLQYNVKDEKWGFAKQQYQYVGEANINVGDHTFIGTIDMFGWSTNETTYGVDPRNLNELYDGEFVDWGNLFPVEDNWSTLSADQWKYLLNERTNASSLKQIARVGSVVGIMLFPDNWNAPLTVTAQHDSYFDVDIHNYTLEQWAALENAGALFLPAAGRRAGGYGNTINKDQVEETNPENLNGGHYKHYDNGNIYCYYWTSTINESTKDVSYLHNIQALGGDKYTIGTGAVWGEKGRYGQSVRLAKVTDIPVVIRKELTVGQLGTVCLPYNIPSGQVYGATFYTLEGKMDNKVVFDEVTGELAAGVPYLFQASAEEISCFPGTTIVTEPNNSGAMKGTFVDLELTELSNIYYFAKNALWSCVDLTKLSVPANRAYVNMAEVTAITGAAPVGVRRITLGVNGQNTATSVDQVQGDEVPTKMIINGQLFILRGEKTYDAQGKLVK